MKEAAELHRW